MAVTTEHKWDFSGGIQSATTWLLRKQNQLEDAYNVRFNKYLGAATRINGYVKEGNAPIASTRSQGLHEAKFSNGAKVFMAQNNTGVTATLIEYYQKSVGSSWTTLSTTIDPNTLVDMNDSIGEMYIAGKSTSTGNRMQIINVKNDLTTSTTRNLYAAPKARYIVEYQGALYAINVDIGGTVFSDRAYRSSQALGAITFIQGNQAFSTTNATYKLDTVQYIKPGMVLDIYKAGTETKTYDSLTVISVDKNLNTMTYAAQTTSSANASANASTDQIVVTSTSLFPTGQPLRLTGGTLPTGLSAGVTYYAINIDSTHLQLATSYSNAISNPAVPVDITLAGSGTATVYQGMNDNDELWGHGRKGELAYYWNTDYPTTDQADFLRIIPGVAADSEITAYAKSNNRLFLFTKTATFKWDNANLVPVFEDIGCINQQTIQNIGDWLIWADAENQIHARNDSTGQHNIISRAIRNKWLENITQAQFATAGAGKSKNVYKICVGTVNGQIWRFTYDFDGNNWSREIVNKTMYNHLYSDMSGNMRLYFTDATGQMWLDEEGNLQDTATIPFYMKVSRENDGVDFTKDLQGFHVYGDNTTGASLKLYIEDVLSGDIGMLKGKITSLVVPNNVKSNGRDYSIEITQDSEGDPISIEGISPYYGITEDKFNA